MGTSPSPSRTTSAPPTSPAKPPTVPPRPPAFARAQSNLLLQPTTGTRAGLSVRLLMVLVLIPCAAVSVLRYGGRR
jgi:hypothetical protein